MISYMKKIIFIFLPLFLLNNCASITESKNQSMSVSTGEVTGAMCTLSNSKGSYYVNSTPGSVTELSGGISVIGVKCEHCN